MTAVAAQQLRSDAIALAITR